MKARRRRAPRLRAFDARKYLGGDGRARIPEARLLVMIAGSAGLYLAILQPDDTAMWAEARRNAAQNRDRFPTRPQP